MHLIQVTVLCLYRCVIAATPTTDHTRKDVVGHYTIACFNWCAGKTFDTTPVIWSEISYSAVYRA